MNPLRTLAGQTAIYGLSSIIGRLLNYLLVPIYTRVFMPSEFGVVAELYAYIAFLNVLLTYGMETSFFRHYNNSNNKNAVFSTSFVSIALTTTLFLLIVISLSQPIANLIHYAHNVEYIYYVALIVALDALTAIPFAKLRAENKAKAFAFIKLMNIGLNIGFNLFFIVLCPYLINNNIVHGVAATFINTVYSSSIGVGYVFISNLIACVFTFIVLLPTLFKIKLTPDGDTWKTMIIYALPLLVAGFAGIINETIDRILLKFLLPQDIAMSQVGIYSACYKISIIITIFIQAFKFAAEPFFFSQSDNKNAKEIYALIMKYFVITCLLIFLVIMMYIDFVKHFVGENYHEGLAVVPILLLANLFLGIYYNLSVWYKLTNRTYFGAYFSIAGAIITIILNLIWIPVWGYVGAAWATLICYFSMMVFSFFWGRKYFKINYPIKRIAFYITFSIALYAISVWLSSFITFKYLVNTILLVVFMLVVFKLEVTEKSKSDLKKIA